MNSSLKVQARDSIVAAYRAISSPLYKHNGSVEKYSSFLDLYRYNPTIGSLLQKKYIDEFSRTSPYFISNLEQIENNRQIKYIRTLIKEEIDTNYPKTKKIREYIIKTNRISPDGISPSRRYTILDRLRIFFGMY